MSPSILTPQRALVRARWGVFGTFAGVGFLSAIWLVNIPDIQERTGTSHAVIGGLILLLGLGALVSMQFTGLLIRRIGSRASCSLGLGLLVITVNLPGMATDAVSLGIALFIFGLGHGITDVAMNQHAVVVEREYGRPIMSAFHAFYSLGGALGAVAAAAGQSTGLDLAWILFIACLVGAAAAASSVPALLSRATERRLETGTSPVSLAEHASPVRDTSGRNRRRIVALAVMAFLILLSEGAANDWSALQTVEHLNEPEAAAALAYGAFAGAMTVGRLLADRASNALGPVRVVRYGSIMAGAGMLAVVVSTFYPLSIIGWTLFGLGLSGIIPQVYTAAGAAGRSDSGKTLARVVSCGYVGLLAGPAIIGWLGGMVGLTLAFILPLLFCGFGVLLAKAVAPGKDDGVADHLRSIPASSSDR
ncbi:MFS transporter [Arthrobacter sp. AK01]|uniref:MFS transporter n=1 Tax=Arthrobacter sp. AK01 TaxID=2894084 RepID=UPI001E409B9D|nr:MFS transporter [Arthrobacter sp. AK01]MCD4851569.1 MFS transporter [Arthrobacter sp. AK01]